MTIWITFLFVAIQDSLRVLVNKLKEQNCGKGGGEGHGRVQIDRIPAREALAEQARHLNTDCRGGVHDGAVGGDRARVSKKDSASANVWGGEHEAIDSFFIWKLRFLICVSHEEEDVHEGAEELLARGPQDERIHVGQLRQVESVEVDEKGTDVCARDLRDNIGNSQFPVHGLVLAENVGERDGRVEVRSADLPEEAVGDPEAEQDDWLLAACEEHRENQSANELHDELAQAVLEHLAAWHAWLHTYSIFPVCVFLL